MTEPDDLFNTTFFRFHDRWTIIDSFRLVFQYGLPHAQRVISEHFSLASDALCTSPEYEHLFKDRNAFIEADLPTITANRIASLTMADAITCVDAASIVFAHALLDDVALDYCRVSARLSPGDWQQKVDKKTIPLRDIKRSSYEELLRKCANDSVEELERQPLLTKVDYLFAACRPAEGYTPIAGYVFDRERLQEIDKLRHAIVHGDALENPSADVNGKLGYIKQTVSFLLCMLYDRYGLQLDPKRLENWIRKEATKA